MSQTDFSTDSNCSRDPLPSYGWRIVRKESTSCGYTPASTRNSTGIYEATTKSFGDNNDSIGGHTKPTHTYNFISSNQMTNDRTTQDYTPTAPAYDIIQSRAILNYRKDDVAVPIFEYPIDKEHAKIRECDEERSPPRIHRYKQITPHVNSNLQMRQSEQQTDDRNCLPIYIILAVSIFCATIFGGIIIIGRYNAHLYHENST